jgi:hypothetical protein
MIDHGVNLLLLLLLFAFSPLLCWLGARAGGMAGHAHGLVWKHQRRSLRDGTLRGSDWRFACSVLSALGSGGDVVQTAATSVAGAAVEAPG